MTLFFWNGIISELTELKNLHKQIFGNDFIPIGNTTLKLYLAALNENN